MTTLELNIFRLFEITPDVHLQGHIRMTLICNTFQFLNPPHEDVAHRFLERYLGLEVQGDVDVGLHFQRYIVLARQILLMNFFRRAAFHPGKKKKLLRCVHP